MAPVKYRAADVDGFKIFYREAGPADAPKLLLLHGFPSAGHMFRDLISLLADRFHMVAPDLPGFGTALSQTNAETFSRRVWRLVYFFRSFALNGGLVSCGFNQDNKSLKRPSRQSDSQG
jgi:pimeloyl-ACP methyl ester carboxylesterase